MNPISKLKLELIELANPEREEMMQKFFKTGVGDYAEKDIFIGVPVPIQRNIIKKYLNLSLEEVEELLQSEIHEHRVSALLILIKKYDRYVKKTQKESIVKCYLKNLSGVNNWDLVDMSASQILGRFAFKDRRYIEVIKELSEAWSIWKNRISMVSTLYFIKQGENWLTCQLAEKLLDHQHPLIHKAIGRMLREVGKNDTETLKQFLNQKRELMSRTMLRCAVEKLSKEEKKQYLL